MAPRARTHDFMNINHILCADKIPQSCMCLFVYVVYSSTHAHTSEEFERTRERGRIERIFLRDTTSNPRTHSVKYALHLSNLCGA